MYRCPKSIFREMSDIHRLIRARYPLIKILWVVLILFNGCDATGLVHITPPNFIGHHAGSVLIKVRQFVVVVHFGELHLIGLGYHWQLLHFRSETNLFTVGSGSLIVFSYFWGP